MTSDDSSEWPGGRRPFKKRSARSDDRRGPKGGFAKRRDVGKGDYRNKDGRGRRRFDKPPSDRLDSKNRQEDPKPAQKDLTIPSDPEKILFKGIDLEENGRADLALIMYIHGASKLSKGCESNVLRILRGMSESDISSARGRVGKSCPEDGLVSFDYLCRCVDETYDVSFIQEASKRGCKLAIYDLIRLDLVDPEDPLIDSLVDGADEGDAMVLDGLRVLSKRKDSAKSTRLIEELDELGKRRRSIRVCFLRALKGDMRSFTELKKLSSEFPEAGFLQGYIKTGDKEGYLREGMATYGDLIVSLSSELDMMDTAFGKYLNAKRVQAKGGDWIQQMINAFMAGSDDALTELIPIQGRKDVKRAMISTYIERGDAAGVVRCFDGEDWSPLERFCDGDKERAIALGELMNGATEIEWLKRCCRNDVDCADVLVSMAASKERRGKLLIYALHDIGEDMEAARLYMDMYGDPTLPSVKWLSKVCSDDAVKDYLRSRFDEIGEQGTFESIFVEDGYERRGPKPRGGFKKRR